MKLSSAVGVVLGSVFLLSATGKAIDPLSMSQAFEAISVPQVVRPPATVSLVGIEALLGLGLVFGFSRTRIPAILILILFTGTLIFLRFHPDKPSCGCLGSFEPDVTFLSSTTFGIGRNLCMVGFLLLLPGNTRNAPARDQQNPSVDKNDADNDPTPPTRRGKPSPAPAD